MAQINLYKKPIAKQRAFINSCVEKINEALEKGNLEKIAFTEDEIAMISDIHGDLFSLMGSMAQCGFKFQKDNFIFYNPEKKEYYYESKGGEYCKYNPNGNPKETNDIIEPQPTEDTELILSPMVDDSEAHPLLCLGDLLDRSPESTAVLILLNTVDKFRALQGDHEFDGMINNKYMGDRKEATEIVPSVLADIKFHNKIPINTYSGKGNDVIEYSHVPTAKVAVVHMFDFLNDYFNGVLITNNNDTDGKTKNEVFGALDKEFEKHRNLFNKLRLFINNYEDFDYDKIIDNGNFSIEELLIIKKVIGDALTKSEINEEGKNREVNFDGLNRFDKLCLKSKNRKGIANILNFYDDFLDSNDTICQCMFGHKNANEVTKYNNNVGIDVQRNEHQNGGTSKANTVVYNKKNGMLKIYESKIKRNTNKELDGNITKSKSITMELKNDEPKETIEKDKKKEKKTKNYDFSNDVKSVEIDNGNNIKITVSTYDFYNNKEKEEIITIKQPYDEVDCVGKNTIFAIFASENNLNINNEKHKEIINNLVGNLFKSDKENDKRDFLNLALSNCDNIDTIKYVLSLEGVKDFITAENKKNFINAALLNKNISVDHLKDIFFNRKEEEEFNKYLKDNFIGKEEEKDEEAEEGEGADFFMTKARNFRSSLSEGEENEEKNKDKFFSTIIYTDNIELLRYLKNKNLLEVEDYKILLERAVIHNKTDIFNEISNNIEEYFGEELKKEENVVELLNIYIGNKDEKLITNLLEKYKGESENIEFNENNLKLLFETAIETKDNAFVNGVHKILSDNKVTIKFEKEDNLESLLQTAIETRNIDIINKVYNDILGKNIEFKENNLELLLQTAIETRKTNIIDKVYNILKKDKDGVEFKNEDNLKSLFEAAIKTEDISIIDNIYKDIFFNEKINIEFKKENNLVSLSEAAIKTKNTDIIDKVYKDIFFNEKVSICEKKVEKDKKGILNKMMGSLLNKFNNSESLDKEIGKNLFDLIKKIQEVDKTEDINFDEIKEEGERKPLKKLFKMAVTNGERELALKIAEQFKKIETKFNSSDINTYLKPAIETGDINLINKVFKICRINKDEFIKIIKCPKDTNKWSNLLEDLIKLPNKEAAKTIINEISVIIKEERAKGEENCNSNSVYYPSRFGSKAKIACFMNTKLSNLLKLSIEHNNMDVFDSIIDIYKDKIFKREGNGWTNNDKEFDFNDQFLKQYFSEFLDEAIKTGKAEIVNEVAESYKTVTGEGLDGENLKKVEEFRKKKNTIVKPEEPKKETKITIKRDPIIWEGINLTEIEEKIEKGEPIDNFNENIKNIHSGFSVNFSIASSKLNKVLELAINNKYYNLFCELVNNEDPKISSLFITRFENNMKNLDILKSLINSGNEEFKKAGWKIVFKNLNKFNFKENTKNPKQFNFNELINDEKVKNSYFYDIFEYTDLGFEENEKFDDASYKNSNKNFISDFLKNNYKNYLNNGGKDIELKKKEKSTEILIGYFINNDEPQELKQRVIEFLNKNTFFLLKSTNNQINQTNQVNDKDIYMYCKDTNKIKKVVIHYDKSKENKILADDDFTSKITNYYKTGTEEVNDEKNKIATAKIIDNEELKFEFKDGTKIEELEKNVNDFFDNIGNNSRFDSNISYLAYATLQLQNGNKNNIVFENDVRGTTNNIIEESKKTENQGKTFVYGYDNSNHCIQIVICNGERIDFNTIGSSSEGVLHTIDQDGLNCVLASKLFFTAVAQEYLATKNGDFSEFVKDMRELSKFIGENNSEQEIKKLKKSNNKKYIYYHNLIEIAARANARLLKGAKKQFPGGVDKDFKNLAGYFGINQETIQPTDLSKKVEPVGPVAKVKPAPATLTASEPEPKPAPEPAPEPIEPVSTPEPAKLVKPAPESTKPTTPSAALTESKKLNPESTEPVSTPEPKKALNIKSMPKYLSDRTVEEQEFSLNDFIGKVNKLHKDEKANEDEISFTTDTHGDLVSLMGAAAMCGVKFKENEFLYYDKVEGVYYKKVGGKYYKYDTMPYTGPQKEHGEPVNINMNNIIVVPIPDIKNARDLYHLGDVLDRGTESLTSLLFCEVCGSIKLAQGNHEFATNINRGNEGHEKEFGPIELALARMKLNGRIATGFYSGKGNNVVSYSHIPLTQKHVEGFFNFLNSTYVDLKYFDKSPSVIEALDKEFVNQTGNSNLRDKVKSFLISHKDNEFGTIEKVFTKEEMLIIKNVVGDALVKRKIREDENGKITLVDGGFNDIYSDFEELKSKEYGDNRNVDILNFEDTENEKDVVVVCNGAAGHQRSASVRNNSNGILYCDDTKSDGYNKGLTKVTITTLKKGTGEYKNSSCAIKRINNGIDSKFGDIKEETGLKLNKYENSTVVDKDKTTGHDFINDVKEIKIDGDNISITFRDGKNDKVISFKKDEYKNNLDCNGRNVIFAAVSCEDFVINNKDFVKNLFGKLKEENKIKLLDHILTNYNDIKLINKFLDLRLSKNKRKSSVPITKPVGELDAKEHLIVSVLSNNKIPNDKISEILKKINNNKEYTKKEFDENFANYKDKICSIIANPNNLGLYQYLSNNNFLDSSYYKELLNFAIKFGNKAICDELFKNDGKKYIDDFSEEEITKLLLTAIKSEKTEFIEKVFDLYKNIKEENIEDIKKSLENNSNNISAILANNNEKVFKCFCDNFNDEDLKEIAENKLLPRICRDNPNLNIVKYLADERNFDLGFKGQKKGRNLLHLACFGNNPNLELIKYLIEEKKINVNSLDENKDTPLNLLCQENFCKADIIKYIVTEGKADVNIKNNQNDTPLNYICVSNPNSEIVKLLLGNKENINDKNTDSKSALDYAVYDSDKFDLETINYLIDNGAIINSENEIFNKEGAFEKNFYNKENLLSFFEVYAKGCPKDRDISIKYNSNNLIGVFNKNFDQTIDLFLGALEQLYTKYSIENKDEKINDLKKKVNEITRKKNGAVANKSKQFVKLIINELNSCLTEIAQSPEKMELLNKNIDEKIQKQKEKKEKEKKEEIKGKAREEEEKKKQNEAEKKKEEELRKQKEEEERRKKENQPPIPPETPEPTENTTTKQPNSKPKPEQETKPTQPQTEDNFEQTYKDLKQKQLKDEIKGKTVEEIKQQKQEEIKNIAKTDNIKTVLTERIEEHEKKVKLVNKAIETTKSIESGSVSVVNKIKEVKGEPGTKQTAVVVKAAKNVKAENLFNDEDFRNITLDEIEVDGKVYKGFGGKIIYSYDDNSGEIRLGFDEGGFVMDQLKRMGFDKNDEYKEVYDIFENGGGLVFNKQPNGIGKEETAEFMARFKLSPVDAYLWICQDKNISIKGENGSEINSDKIKEVLTAVTEARHAMASAIYYTESIKNGMEKQKKDEDESSEEEEKEENEELNNYEELANFIKECSMKISKENSVNGFGLNVNGVEFKNPIFTVKCLNKILKIVDNKVNGECREGEEEVLKEIIDNFKGNIKGNKNVILSNCLLKMYDFSLEKAGKKIDNIVATKASVVDKLDF